MSPSSTALSDRIHQHLTGRFPADEPGVTAIVVRSGEVVYRGAFGLADLELGVPLDPDTVLRAGSITKQFTAVAILLLTEQGRISLDEPFTRYLPGYTAASAPVTVEHLLTHTSGIPNRDPARSAGEFWQGMRHVAPQQLIDAFRGQPLLHTPGEQFSYGNSAYFLLGAIVEAVSGQSLRNFLAHRVFDPLEMRRTQIEHPARLIRGRARGYRRGSDGFRNSRYINPTQAYAAGGLVSTVDDLGRFHAALESGEILNRETLNRAWRSFELADGTPTRYGYGWSLPDEDKVEHGGGIAGFHSHAFWLREEQAYVALLRNAEGARAVQCAFHIEALLRGNPTAPRPTVIPAAHQVEQFVGRYQFGPADEARVEHAEGELFWVTQAARSAICIVSQREFYLRSWPTVRMHWQFDATGEQVVGCVDAGHLGPGIGRKLSAARA